MMDHKPLRKEDVYLSNIISSPNNRNTSIVWSQISVHSLISDLMDRPRGDFRWNSPALKHKESSLVNRKVSNMDK